MERREFLAAAGAGITAAKPRRSLPYRAERLCARSPSKRDTGDPSITTRKNSSS
jgi:hypothetical protein